MNAATTQKSPALVAFERMLGDGKDNALLRYSIGNEYLKIGEFDVAADHLAHAVAFDPEYTGAWKLLAKALAAANRRDEAIDAYRNGIDVAKRKGDRQAEREMAVFLRRLEKA